MSWGRRKAAPCLLSTALRGETVNGLGGFHPSRTEPFPPLSSAPCLPPPATGKLWLLYTADTSAALETHELFEKGQLAAAASLLLPSQPGWPWAVQEPPL